MSRIYAHHIIIYDNNLEYINTLLSCIIKFKQLETFIFKLKLPFYATGKKTKINNLFNIIINKVTYFEIYNYLIRDININNNKLEILNLLNINNYITHSDYTNLIKKK